MTTSATCRQERWFAESDGASADHNKRRRPRTGGSAPLSRPDSLLTSRRGGATKQDRRLQRLRRSYRASPRVTGKSNAARRSPYFHQLPTLSARSNMIFWMASNGPSACPLTSLFSRIPVRLAISNSTEREGESRVIPTSDRRLSHKSVTSKRKRIRRSRCHAAPRRQGLRTCSAAGLGGRNERPEEERRQHHHRPRQPKGCGLTGRSTSGIARTPSTSATVHWQPSGQARRRDRV